MLGVLEDLFKMSNFQLEQIDALFDRKFNEYARKQLGVQGLKEPLESKGNKAQLNHQLAILNFLEDIELAVKSRDGDKVLELVEKAKTSVNNRIKVIRFADKSPNGWKAASYFADHIDDDFDSEDEKKMKAAEVKAEAERRRAGKRSRAGSSPDGFFRGRQPFRGVPLSRGGFTQSRRFSFAGRSSGASSSRGNCFACGESGHWRVACPNVIPASEDTKKSTQM